MTANYMYGDYVFYADCFQYAVNNLYAYFGLQYFEGGGYSKGQCFLSNDLTQVTKYGNLMENGHAITSYTSSIDNKLYGGANANAVYMVGDDASYKYFDHSSLCMPLCGIIVFLFLLCRFTTCQAFSLRLGPRLGPQRPQPLLQALCRHQVWGKGIFIL